MLAINQPVYSCSLICVLVEQFCFSQTRHFGHSIIDCVYQLISCDWRRMLNIKICNLSNFNMRGDRTYNSSLDLVFTTDGEKNIAIKNSKTYFYSNLNRFVRFQFFLFELVLLFFLS